MIDRAAHFYPLGIKVTEESGFGPFKAWRTFSDAERVEIVRQAQRVQAPIFVHSFSEQEFANALKLKPYAFMHGGFHDKVPSAAIIKKIRQSNAYVVSTVHCFD